MPSGAKKRKAAKKKKESQPSNISNPSSASTASHGGEDVKHRDEKGSDVGELSSPASQDNHSHQSHFTEGEEEEIEKVRNCSNRPPVEGSRSNGSKTKVDKEFRTESQTDKKDGSFEQDEASRKSYDGGSSGSSSGNTSGSDDEAHGKKNIQAAGGNVSSVEPVNKENGEKKQRPFQDNVSTSVAFMDTALKEEAIIQSDGKTSAILEPKKDVEQGNDDRLTLPHNADRTIADNGVQHERGSGVTQPLLVPSQAPVQKTSWKSCCGLFEMFSGSNT